MKTSNSILLTAVTWNMESKNGMLTISYIPSNSILYPMFRFCEHKFHFKETMRTSRSKPFIQFKNFSRQQLKKNKPHAKQTNLSPFFEILGSNFNRRQNFGNKERNQGINLGAPESKKETRIRKQSKEEKRNRGTTPTAGE